MGKQIEKFKQWIVNDPVEQEPQEDPIDKAVNRALSWLLRNLIPVLLISLVIDVTIIFTTPIEYTESLWFRLKDLASIGIAYLIYKLLKILAYVCRI